MRLEIVGTSDYVPTVHVTHDPTSGWQHVSTDILFAGMTIDPNDPNARLTSVLREYTGDYSWANLDNINVKQVPEPTTMLLLGIGLVGLAGFGRKKIKKGAGRFPADRGNRPALGGLKRPASQSASAALPSFPRKRIAHQLNRKLS